MSYSSNISEITSCTTDINSNLDTLKAIDFSANWSGPAYTKINGNLTVLSSAVSGNVAAALKIADALKQIDTYDEYKEKEEDIINRINNLDPNSDGYNSSLSSLYYTKGVYYNSKIKAKEAAESILSSIVVSYESKFKEIVFDDIQLSGDVFSSILEGNQSISDGFDFNKIPAVVYGNQNLIYKEDPNYTASVGDVVTLPSGYGTAFTYMGWQCITSKTSAQYKLREDAGMNFTNDGIGIINGRYVVATTTTYGKVGDYIDVKQSDGTVIPCIIGDIKSSSDPGCNTYGHNNGNNVIEFVVDKNTWYDTAHGGQASSMHANAGSANFMPELGGKTITTVTNVGSYYD